MRWCCRKIQTHGEGKAEHNVLLSCRNTKLWGEAPLKAKHPCHWMQLQLSEIEAHPLTQHSGGWKGIRHPEVARGAQLQLEG